MFAILPLSKQCKLGIWILKTYTHTHAHRHKAIATIITTTTAAAEAEATTMTQTKNETKNAKKKKLQQKNWRMQKQRSPKKLTFCRWGEFDSKITIEFKDPNEAPVSVIHTLRLYPASTNSVSALPSNMRKPVWTKEQKTTNIWKKQQQPTTYTQQHTQQQHTQQQHTQQQPTTRITQSTGCIWILRWSGVHQPVRRFHKATVESSSRQ